MKLGNASGRLVLVRGDQQLDIEMASNGRFAREPQRAFDWWDELREWATGEFTSGWTKLRDEDLLAPIPHPRQIFAIALNYREHAEEVGIEIPKYPSVFTKFPGCLVGPSATVELPSERVDWELELVVAVGRPTFRVAKHDAWSHVAGLMIGQDISERRVQLRPPSPQFSLGKSYPTFGPIGPLLVTPDELADPDDLDLKCYVNDELVQASCTSNLIFGICDLIEYISSIARMFPGDLIFTGTPSGVGSGRDPRRYLQPGDVIRSEIQGLGEMRNPCEAFVSARHG